jgi:hypothetical protein
MAITTAAEKTTAAFFMGFPFTKIVVDNKSRIRWRVRLAVAFLSLREGPSWSMPN